MTPRQEAKAAGHLKYDGRACKGCGGTLRYTSTANCVSCQGENVIKQRDGNYSACGAHWHDTPRNQAKRQGLKRFRRVCPVHGDTEWLVSSNQCMACNNEKRLLTRIAESA